MTTRTNTSSTLENSPMPAQAKIAAAWTSFMFMYAYVDIIGFYKPGVLDDILAGFIFEFEVSAMLLTTFIAVLAVPALMVVLSMTLRPRVNRVTNLVVASLYIPFTVFNVVGETAEWVFFYGLTVGIEVLLLAFILRSAWTWPRTVSAAETVAA